MILRRRFLVFLFVVQLSLGAYSLWAQDATVAKIVDEALADPALTHGIQGILIESLNDGRILYEKNADLVFIPASNHKLIVSACALDTLGADYHFKTFLYTRGEQTADGILHGDIVIQGRGDPVLKSDDLSIMVSKIKELGIHTVEGNVIADDTWFDGIRLGWGWSWDDEPYYYSAQISALNLDENVVSIWVRPGEKVGDLATVEVQPPTSYVSIENECKTSEAGSQKAIFIDRVRAKNVIRVKGVIPIDYKQAGPEEAITVEEPALYTAHRLVELLKAQGIEVKGTPSCGKRPADARFVMSHVSPPLCDIIRMLNKPSDNLIAEVLLKTLGAERKGYGSASKGEEVEMEFLKKIGADLTAISISDGSGLSRLNLVSPRNLVTILKYMYRHPKGQVFMDSLPVAGVDGTLRKRMKGTPAEGNVRAKTGYVGRVASLSGYVTTKSGEPLVFSMIFNNHLCRHSEATAVMDKILAAVAAL